MLLGERRISAVIQMKLIAFDFQCVFRSVVVASAALVFLSMCASRADEDKMIFDSFDLDKLNTDLWCPCQVKADSPVRFPKKSGGGRFLRIMADEASLGGNICDYELKFECEFPPFDPDAAADEKTGLISFATPGARSQAIRAASETAREEAEAEFAIPEGLGPSMIQMLRDEAKEPAFPEGMTLEGLKTELNALSSQGLFEETGQEAPLARLLSPTHRACGDRYDTRFYCDRDAHARADGSGEENTCIQRQELRVRFGKQRPHASDQPMWYSMRFRMPASIEDTCNSVRWVTAQWKHKNSALADRSVPQSPMLAQRFDDGVLHVTVQDGPCRCIVASAFDPRARTQRKWDDAGVDDKELKFCTNPAGDRCNGRFKLDYTDSPVLESPLGEWTTMSYFLKAGWQGDGEIRVFQDEREIVKITGNIGYEIGDDSKNQIKFKFGHYRDYMPFHHEMDVDYVRIDFDPPEGINSQ